GDWHMLNYNRCNICTSTLVPILGETYRNVVISAPSFQPGPLLGLAVYMLQCCVPNSAGGSMSVPIAASPRRTILLAAVLLFVVTLFVYLVTLSPTVNFIDSGEIITVGATAGIAHPPGYPLYTLLIIAASALPFGNEAVR